MVMEKIEKENNFESMFKDAFDLDKTFRPFGVNFNKLKNIEKPLYQTGFSFIDEPLRGIMQEETWLIGADSGYGKTEMAAILSMNLANQNIKTLFIALECYDGEIEDRRKFPLVQNEVYKKTKEILYQKDWICGKYKNKYLDIEKAISLDDNISKNLYMRYRSPGEDYNIKTIESDLDRVLSRKEIKIVIIDHVHHFDMGTENENIELKNLIKKICTLSQVHKLPIICFGQLRKRSIDSDVIVPTYEDFYGTSELYKNVSAVITIAPDFETKADSLMFPTNFRISKGRGGTHLRKYCFGTIYNAIEKNYEKKYFLYLLKKGGTKKEIILPVPDWCKSYKLPEVEKSEIKY